MFADVGGSKGKSVRNDKEGEDQPLYNSTGAAISNAVGDSTESGESPFGPAFASSLDMVHQ